MHHPWPSSCSTTGKGNRSYSAPGANEQRKRREAVENKTDKSVDPSLDTGAEVLKVRLSLKGRPMKVCTFQKEVVTVGRDPDSDIYLDNPGISRHHLRLERCAEGYYAEDLESANGTFLNDAPIRKALVRHDDVIRVGKFSLWMTYEKDRRRQELDAQTVSPNSIQGTTVLSTTEIEDMIARAREVEPGPPVTEEPDEVEASSPVRGRLASVALLGFCVGASLGAALTWFFLR